MKLRRAKKGRKNRRGPQVMMRMRRGSGGGRSGETALSSGISENVDEKDRRRAVKGGGWCEHLLTRGENTSSVLERARRLYSGAQAGMAGGRLARAARALAYKQPRYRRRGRHRSHQHHLCTQLTVT